MLTLEEYMHTLSDAKLLEMFDEIETGSVPLTGPTHTERRKINDMIDAGELKVQRTYARLYLNNFVRAIYREMALRLRILTRVGM